MTDLLQKLIPRERRGSRPRLVMDHAGAICPRETWGRQWSVNGRAFVPLIRSAEIAVDQPISAFVVGGV